MMTQSMDPSKLAARLDNGRDLMTASLDPSILMANIDHDNRVIFFAFSRKQSQDIFGLVLLTAFVS